MSLKHQEIEIEEENAFANCKLDRKKYANVLTHIIENYSSGFVLAINNKWGTGKTTFVKMWNQDLKNKGYKTLFFNAWENDFENSPLTALMGELKSLKTQKNEKQFLTVMQGAAKLTKHLAPTIVKAIVDKYINTETINQAIIDVTKGLTDIFENDVKEYTEKKQSIQEFKKSLSKFVADTNNEKPLVFIIDELDRCRPDYAVSILEQIKHFFSVPNIVFVLSIDKSQLKNAICGVYGNANIDSEEYLRRFIDIEYSLPEPETGLFYKYLYDYFEFDQFFKSVKRKECHAFDYDKNNFLGICDFLFSSGSVSLRQQEKIFSHSRLALRAFASNNYVIPPLFLFLVYLKSVNEDSYNLINNKTISVEELQQILLNNIKTQINDNNIHEIIWLEVYLVNSYSNYLNYPHHRNKITKYEDGKNVLLVKSVIDKTEDSNRFLSVFDGMNRFDGISDMSIGHLLNKINLTEAFKL